MKNTLFTQHWLYVYVNTRLHLSTTVLQLSVVEKELLAMLPLSEQCLPDEAELVRFCYESMLNKVRLRMLKNVVVR